MIQATTQMVATVQSILNKFHTQSSNPHVEHVLQQLKNCRTAQLGYHLYKCNNNDCMKLKYQYHSCRNRHCPACGSMQKEQWIDDRRTELLPINYYHVVFTLPHELNGVILGNRKLLFKLLFDKAAETLLDFAKTPKHLGAIPGILAVLHTWGQQLSFHPHLHCVVSGGGIIKTKDGVIWKNGTRNKDDFLFPVKALAIVFRAKYLQALKNLILNQDIILPPNSDLIRIISTLYSKDWVVYAKKPFGGPHQVLEYLGRYTHKVAITNNRLVDLNTETNTVTFDYKDYSDNNEVKQMQLTAPEFIRRYEQHILPKYFTKIRSYGYLSNRNRKANIKAITVLLKLPPHADNVKIPWHVRLLEKYKISYDQCPHCEQHTLVLVAVTFEKKGINDG